MRILFLAPQPFFAERGTPIAVRLAVETLARLGHDVDLLTYHEGTDVELPGVRHHRIGAQPGMKPVPIGFSVSKLRCDAAMLPAAVRLLRRNSYDVIHAVEEAVFIAMILRRFANARVVYDVDSIMSDQIAEKWPAIGPLAAVLRMLEGSAFRRSDLVLPVCEALADRARAYTDASKVHVLPDVALAAGSPGPAAEDLRRHVGPGRQLALYVGNLEEYQGFDLLLDGLAQLPPERRCTLIAIGGTPEAVARYTARTEAACTDSDVVFLGPRPLDHLQHYLRQADILCSPRRKGVNTPMKIYSYMASGRAILATDIQSHTQVLDASTAKLVAATPSGLAEGLAELGESASLRETLGRNAALRAHSDYSLAAFERRLATAYRQITIGCSLTVESDESIAPKSTAL